MRRGDSPRRHPAAGMLIVCVGFGAVGCTSDEWPLEGDESSSSGDGNGSSSTSGDSIEGARLEVFEPESPSIHYLGESVPLVAEVRGPDDLSIGFEDIVWTADTVEQTLFFGADGAAELAPGIYEITATAKLPGGDRLESTVGGVRVQTRWTGVYSGDAFLTLHVDFQGTPLTPTCNGALDLVAQFDGDTVVFESGSCTLNAVLTTFDATYTIEGVFHNGVGQGTISYDLGLFQLDFDWTGGFIEDGFVGVFADTVSLPFVGDVDANGHFDAAFVTPYVDPPP